MVGIAQYLSNNDIINSKKTNKKITTSGKDKTLNDLSVCKFLDPHLFTVWRYLNKTQFGVEKQSRELQEGFCMKNKSTSYSQTEIQMCFIFPSYMLQVLFVCFKIQSNSR